MAAPDTGETEHRSNKTSGTGKGNGRHTFHKLDTWYSITGGTSMADTVILIDTMGEEQQKDLVARLSKGKNWTVIANVDNLALGIQEELDSRGQAQTILTADRGAKQPVQHPNVYAKGWWKMGSKRICLSKGVWRGKGGEDLAFTLVVGTPIVDSAFEGQLEGHTGQVSYYMNQTLSGQYLKSEGLPVVVWRQKNGEG